MNDANISFLEADRTIRYMRTKGLYDHIKNNCHHFAAYLAEDIIDRVTPEATLEDATPEEATLEEATSEEEATPFLQRKIKSGKGTRKIGSSSRRKRREFSRRTHFSTRSHQANNATRSREAGSSKSAHIPSNLSAARKQKHANAGRRRRSS